MPGFGSPDDKEADIDSESVKPSTQTEANVKEIFDDIIVGKGIANALNFFGARGMLGRDRYFEKGKA